MQSRAQPQAAPREEGVSPQGTKQPQDELSAKLRALAQLRRPDDAGLPDAATSSAGGGHGTGAGAYTLRDFVRAQILGSRYKEHTMLTATGYRVRVPGPVEDSFALGFLARAALSADNKEQDLAINSVETISTAFMGMTVGCAKCQDHKFDPIRQKDFYAMKALFDPLVVKKATVLEAL